MNTRFGPVLRDFRKSQGLTLQQMAARLGYATHGYLGDVERGKKEPSAELLAGLADAFELGAPLLLVIDGLEDRPAAVDLGVPLVDRPLTPEELELLRLLLSARQVGVGTSPRRSTLTGADLSAALTSLIGPARLVSGRAAGPSLPCADVVVTGVHGDCVFIECKQAPQPPGGGRLRFPGLAVPYVPGVGDSDDADALGRSVVEAMAEARSDGTWMQLTLLTPSLADPAGAYALHQVPVDFQDVQNATWEWSSARSRELVGVVDGNPIYQWVVGEREATYRLPASRGTTLAEWPLEPLPRAVRGGLVGLTASLFPEQVKALASESGRSPVAFLNLRGDQPTGENAGTEV